MLKTVYGFKTGCFWYSWGIPLYPVDELNDSLS